MSSLTEPVIKVMAFPSALANKEPNEQKEMAHDDEGRGQDGLGFIFYHKAVTLEFPDLVGYGIHLVEGITGNETMFK